MDAATVAPPAALGDPRVRRLGQATTIAFAPSLKNHGKNAHKIVSAGGCGAAVEDWYGSRQPATAGGDNEEASVGRGPEDPSHGSVRGRFDAHHGLFWSGGIGLADARRRHVPGGGTDEV